MLHRLFASGSDRGAEHWKEGYRLPGTERLQLHQLYRALAWLGENLPEPLQQAGKTRSPRCVKDMPEEMLFTRRQTLFSELDTVFFDAPSLHFKGEGGQVLGACGLSKDKRPAAAGKTV